MTRASPGEVRSDALVSTAWLAEHLKDTNLKVVDATYHLPNVKRDARAEFTGGHIPGAVFFDIDGIADHSIPLPHMLPGEAAFASAMAELGIGDGDLVVAYDSYGLMSAARAWWMLRAFGHDKVAVLDGGLKKWKAEGRALESGTPKPPRGRFTARLRPALVRSKGDILANIKSRKAQVVDARSAERFRGTAPEPRPGLRSGHIPGSHSVPLNNLLDPLTSTMLPLPVMLEKFAAGGVDVAQPVVTSCGSGVTACGLALGLHLLGAPDVAVYDGSWSEWGLPGDTPVDSG